MVDFKKSKKAQDAKPEYLTLGKVIAHRPDHEKVALKGLITLEGSGAELVLFYPKDEELEKCRDNGWDEPIATGSAKHKDNVVFWVRAYAAESEKVCCKLQITSNSPSKEKYTCTLFYNQDNEQVLEGVVQVKVPF